MTYVPWQAEVLFSCSAFDKLSVCCNTVYPSLQPNMNLNILMKFLAPIIRAFISELLTTLSDHSNNLINFSWLLNTEAHVCLTVNCTASRAEDSYPFVLIFCFLPYLSDFTFPRWWFFDKVANIFQHRSFVFLMRLLFFKIGLLLFKRPKHRLGLLYF